jgi:hypothetical protein
MVRALPWKAVADLMTQGKNVEVCGTFLSAVFREASSKIIAWSTPAKFAGNILGPARKPLV